ncbi:MAG: hypothetical protein E7456_01710 [Ruminococcaceae bacterium]|nr:hypothetical protein [Oscillospiraceae bacterium]
MIDYNGIIPYEMSDPMKIVDIRPTLASWPKRIWDWSELPEEFHPSIADWRSQGMEPGNVTYIPRVHQGGSDEEYATAWWKDEVMIQTSKDDEVETVVLKSGTVPSLVYEHQLLKCKIILPRKDGGTMEFGFQQVKEEQLRPVINLLLGRPGERPFPTDHPDHSFDWLLGKTLMYHPTILCYRFDDKINDNIWFKSSLRILPFIARRRPRPEYFFAVMDKGLVVIDRNFYRKRLFYFNWSDIDSIKIEPNQWRGGPGVNVVGKSGIVAQVPLIKDNIEPMSEFLYRVKKLGIRGVWIEDDISFLDKK